MKRNLILSFSFDEVRKIILESSQFFSYQSLKKEKKAIEVGQSLRCLFEFGWCEFSIIVWLIGTAVAGTVLILIIVFW